MPVICPTEVMLAKLADPLPPGELKWHIAGSTRLASGIEAFCRPHASFRAIQAQLDRVCGLAGWQTAVQDHGGPRLQCGIGVRVGDEWLWRWDGTGSLEPTERMKSAGAGNADHANGFKRAAAQFGIGKYLDRVPRLRAYVSDDGRFYGVDRDTGEEFRWDPPAVPTWALPAERPPIVADMSSLLQKFSTVWLNASDEKRQAGIALIERAIAAHDVQSLLRARPWLEGELAKLEPN